MIHADVDEEAQNCTMNGDVFASQRLVMLLSKHGDEYAQLISRAVSTQIAAERVAVEQAAVKQAAAKWARDKATSATAVLEACKERIAAAAIVEKMEDGAILAILLRRGVDPLSGSCRSYLCRAASEEDVDEALALLRRCGAPIDVIQHAEMRIVRSEGKESSLIPLQIGLLEM